MAAVDLFLKIDGIAGESTDARHTGEIEVLAFSWAEHQSVPSGGGGGGSGVGKVQIGELHVVMRASKASPLLMLACAQGTHVKTAVLSSRRHGNAGQKDFLAIKLTVVSVTSYRIGATESGEDDLPTDQVSLAFGKIEFGYSPQKPDGSLAPAITATWDVKKNA